MLLGYVDMVLEKECHPHMEEELLIDKDLKVDGASKRIIKTRNSYFKKTKKIYM